MAAVFPAIRHSDIIGNTVAMNETQTSWLRLRVLLSRLSKILPSKEAVKERCRPIRYADDLVRRLTIKFGIELGLRSAIAPVGKRLELTPSQAPLRDRNASDRNAHARR